MLNDSTNSLQGSSLHPNKIREVLLSGFMPEWSRESNGQSGEFTFSMPLMLQSDTSLIALGATIFSISQTYHEQTS